MAYRALLLLVALAVPSVARADPATACKKFETAIVVSPLDVPTMLELGHCNEGLGKLATAIYWYRRATAAASEQKLDELERSAKDLSLTLNPKVPIAKLVVTGADVTVEIDEKRIEPTGYQVVELDPGVHELVGRAPGKRAIRQKITANVGEKQTIDVAVVEQATPVYVDAGHGRRKAGVIVGGIGLGLLAVAGVYGYIEKGNYEDPTATQREYEAARNRLRYIGSTIAYTGLGLVITGTVLYLTAPGQRKVSDGTAIAPFVGDGEYGLTMAGRF